MMSWNYRVLRYADGTLGIHEVYYDGVSDEATGCTEDAVDVAGDDLTEVREILEAMSRALAAPILDYESIEKLTPHECPKETKT